jgi:hypothetical protein
VCPTRGLTAIPRNHAALSFAGDATRAELEGVEAIGLDGNGIRASADAELEMTDTAASGRVGRRSETATTRSAVHD